MEARTVPIWFAGELAGSFFVQRIALDLWGRPRDEIAAAWVRTLVGAIREEPHTLTTVGDIPWAMVWTNARSVVHVPATSNLLDFVALHIYPRSGELDRATFALRVHGAIGKPVVVEEIFPLGCRIEELERWMRTVRDEVEVWIGFYWGATWEDLRAAPASISNARTLGWLEFFRRAAPEFALPWPPHPRTGAGPASSPSPQDQRAGFSIQYRPLLPGQSTSGSPSPSRSPTIVEMPKPAPPPKLRTRRRQRPEAGSNE